MLSHNKLSLITIVVLYEKNVVTLPRVLIRLVLSTQTFGFRHVAGEELEL